MNQDNDIKIDINNDDNVNDNDIDDESILKSLFDTIKDENSNDESINKPTKDKVVKKKKSYKGEGKIIFKSISDYFQ